MHQIQDVLIPSRFLIFMLQILLTICACITKQDNILAGLAVDITVASPEYNTANSIFLAGIILFYIFEAIEMGILLSGITLFNNKLSIARNTFNIYNLISLLEIFFHSVCVLLLLWYNHKQWESTSIWTEWAIGGIVPVILELLGLFTVTFTHRKVSKIT